MKKQRQKVLIDFIQNNVVDTQDDIQKMLEASGFKVTQATVSRDIKDLRIVKAVDGKGVYRYIYNTPRNSDNMQKKYVDIFVNSVVGIDYAMNDIVIKCHPGMASGACAALDEIFGESLMGSLAGTIFAITKSEKDAAELVLQLKDLLK